MIIVFCTAFALGALIWSFEQFPYCLYHHFYSYVLLNNFTEFNGVNNGFWLIINNIYQFFRCISLNFQLVWTILNVCLKIPLLALFVSSSPWLQGSTVPATQEIKHGMGCLPLCSCSLISTARENPVNLSWAVYYFIQFSLATQFKLLASLFYVRLAIQTAFFYSKSVIQRGFNFIIFRHF